MNNNSNKQKLYYHGRKSGSRPYSGEYIYITDDLGYASGYSDGKILYTYTIPFGRQKIFSVKNPRDLQRLSKYIDKQAIELIQSTSGGDEMDWAALTYIDNDNYSSPEDLFEHLGYLGIAMKERQGIESLYIFNEKNLDFRGTIDITTPDMTKKIQKFYRDFTKDKNFLEEGRRNEVLDELHALLTEGVADKFAEKQFGIPDDNVAMDRKATAGLPREHNMGELLAEFPVWNYGKYEKQRVFMNPRSLQNFGEDVKALSTVDGDLFVAESDLPMYHSDILNGIYDGRVYNKPIYNAYNERYYITMHRIGTTDEFGWSVSYKRFGENPRNLQKVQKMMEVVQKKNPRYTFTPKYWEYIKTGEEPRPWHTQNNSHDSHDGHSGDFESHDIDDHWGNSGDMSHGGDAEFTVRHIEENQVDSSEPHILKVIGNFETASRKADSAADAMGKDPSSWNGTLGNAMRDNGHIQYDNYMQNSGNREEQQRVADELQKTAQEFAEEIRSEYQWWVKATRGKGMKKYASLSDMIEFFRSKYSQGMQEGIADRYAEKTFGISDSNTADNLRAMQGLLGKPSAVVSQRELSVPIYKNPRTLSGFAEDVRAIAVNTGDLYVMQMNEEIMHGKMGRALGFEEVYGSNELVLLHRVGDTNEFGFGDSASGHVERNPNNWKKSVEILRKAKAVNPQFDFYPIYYQKVLELELQPVDASGSDDYDDFQNQFDEGVTTEGVADRYAEKEFHIADPNVAMDRKAIQGLPKDTSMGELVGVIGDQGNLYVNPRSLENFDSGVRAISNGENQLFVAQTNGSFLHFALGNTIKHSGVYNLVGGTYDESQNITWIRIKDKNAFGLGESMMNYFDKSVENQQDVIRRTAELQKVHREFRFIPQLYWSINAGNLKEDLNTATTTDEGVTTEGIADRYAEKQFGISDPNVEMDRKATAGIPVDNSSSNNTSDPRGTLVGQDKAGNEVLRVFMNPRSLEDFEGNVKAVSNAQGDLFIAEQNLPIYHSNIINAIEKIDVYDSPVYNAYEEEYNVTWHRIETTNEFGWSVSYRDFGSRPQNFPKVVEMQKAVEAKNPQFKFNRRYWQEILQQRYDARHNVNNDSLLNFESIIREEIQDFVGEADIITNDENLDRIKDRGNS